MCGVEQDDIDAAIDADGNRSSRLNHTRNDKEGIDAYGHAKPDDADNARPASLGHSVNLNRCTNSGTIPRAFNTMI
jgi:hypothetical protein